MTPNPQIRSCNRSGPLPSRLDPSRDRGPVRPAATRPRVSRADRPPRCSTTTRVQLASCCRSRPAAARRIAATARRARILRTGVQGRQADGRRARSSPSAGRAKAAARTRFCMGAAWREPQDGANSTACSTWSRGVQALGHGSLRHARHAHADQAQAPRRRPGSTPTTTTSTPRRNSTARSSPPAPTRTGWRRSAHVRDGRHRRVLRRHHRHGRDRATTALCCCASWPTGPAARERADQLPGADAPARRWKAARRSMRSTWCA